MTSRRLYSDNLRHRKGALLACILFVAIHLFELFLETHRIVHAADYTMQDKRDAFLCVINPDIIFVIPVMVLAIIMAYSAFGYLHDKRTVDFYHALPVTRKQMYRAITINSILLFMATLVLDLSGQILLAVTSGLMTPKVIHTLAAFAILYPLVFLINYGFAALAIILTGNTLTSILGITAFFIYTPMFVMYLFPLYADVFFNNYTWMTMETEFLYYFSPLSLSIILLVPDNTVLGFQGSQTSWFSPCTVITCIVFVLWIIVLYCLTKRLYEKRPSETTGEAMAFKITKPLIKVFTVVPAALYSGLFVCDIADSHHIGWLIAGIVVGTFLFHGIIEMIYEKDFRGFYRKPAAFILLSLIAMGIGMIFYTDCLHINSRLAKENETETVVIDKDISDTY